MIIHASIVADEPQRAAELIARLMGGGAFPWMGPGEGTWIATGEAVFGETVEVIEVWIDGCFLLEVMTPEMASAYGALMSPENLKALRAALAAGLPPAAIAEAARERVSP